MCAHNIISGIMTWFYVCTQHHLWNDDLILCVHTTSSLESWPDFMCAHNFISGIMTWFYVCTQHHAQHHLWNHNMISWVRTTSSLESWPDFMCIQKIIAGIITRFLINVASQETVSCRKLYKSMSRGAKSEFCCYITLLIWGRAFSKVYKENRS